MNNGLKKNTTDLQCAGLVASIGCPRRLEICNGFGRKLPTGAFVFRTEEQAQERRRAAAQASGWIFDAA